MYVGTCIRSPEGFVTVEVQTDDGSLPLYVRPIDGKYFTVSRPGEHFWVVVKNNHSRRTSVVLSVDGVNVLNGNLARRSQGEGLTLDTGETWRCDGWVSEDEAEERLLTFGSFTRAMADHPTQTPGMSTSGVIGIAAYAERLPDMRLRNASREADYPSRPRSIFDSGSDQLIIGYDTEQNLVDQGIVVLREPDPWPGEREDDDERERP